jgi:hypothetical protein
VPGIDRPERGVASLRVDIHESSGMEVKMERWRSDGINMPVDWKRGFGDSAVNDWQVYKVVVEVVVMSILDLSPPWSKVRRQISWGLPLVTSMSVWVVVNGSILIETSS